MGNRVVTRLLLHKKAQVEWDRDWDPKGNPIESGELYGLGRHRPHGQRWMGDECTRPPEVSVEYSDKDRGWVIRSVTAYTEVDVQEPVEEAYPVFGRKSPEENNVVDDPKLGTRTPPDRTGKGHWENVIRNLLLYGTADYRPDRMRWWVRGSTFSHEKVHHREYKKWFRGKWGEFFQKMGEALNRKLTGGQIQPPEVENVKGEAGLILKRIIEEDGWPPGSEPQAYRETRADYWEKTAGEIRDYFSGEKKEKGELPIHRRAKDKDEGGPKSPETQKSNYPRGAVSPDLENSIRSLPGGGLPLPQSLRSFFEPRFGSDFSHVRIHGNEQAARMAGAVGARAFTVGKDIGFGAGQYAPETAYGKRLLAHELAHVFQQTNSPRTGILSQNPPSPGRVHPSKKSDPQLRLLAASPREAMDEWDRLGLEDRNTVSWYMGNNYGDEFAGQFIRYASSRKRPEPVIEVTNRMKETETQLNRRGYYLSVDYHGGTEIWVHPSGRELWRIRPRKGGPRHPSPEEIYGPLLRSREDTEILGRRGRAEEYSDGTILLYPGGTGMPVSFRPRPGPVEEYGYRPEGFDLYDQNGVKERGIYLFIPDRVFGVLVEVRPGVLEERKP